MPPTHHCFKKTLRVQFSHCDPAGIVFFPQYLYMLNDLVEDWVCSGLGISYSGMIHQRRIGMPTASLNCEFVAVSHHGDDIHFELEVERLGSKSITLNVRCLGADGLRMRVTQVIVFMDLGSQGSMAIPEDFRAAMQRYVRPA